MAIDDKSHIVYVAHKKPTKNIGEIRADREGEGIFC